MVDVYGISDDYDIAADWQEALVRSHGRGDGPNTGHGMVWRVVVVWWPPGRRDHLDNNIHHLQIFTLHYQDTLTD